MTKLPFRSGPCIPVEYHHTVLVGQALPADYFRPPSPAENPVNKVTAFFPPTGFVGVFERNRPGHLWVRTS